MQKAVIVIITILVLVAVFSGCEASPADITGLWYEKTGLAGTLEFKDDDTVIMVISEQTYNGTYKFDDQTNKGEINITEPINSTSSFILSKGEIDVENGTAVYTRDKANSKSIGSIIQGLDNGEDN